MEKKYELWKCIDGYSVVWFDEETGIEMIKDYPEGEEYPFSDWAIAPNFIGEYTTEREAWVAASIDCYCSTIGDPRLHPRYSYKYKCIV